MVPNRRLKQVRELRGWSQAKVAEQIGTDATTVSRWERGVFSPTPYFRERLCKLFSKNAEELGLLEAVDQPQERAQNSFSLQPPMTIPSFQANKEWQRDDEQARSAVSLMPPSWPKRTDTFSYILHSVAYDQQAHMLWGDAYVQALRGQHDEAQQLGEASLNAFERVGHLNATAIREWLNQRESVSPPSPPASNVPPTPLPMLPDQHKRPARRFMRGRGTGIALLLMGVLALVLTGFSFNQFYPANLASPLAAHALSVAQTAAPTISATTPASKPTPTPALSPTPISVRSSAPTPGRSSTPTPSTFTAQVTPARLNAQGCPLESIGYRCTLTLSLYTTSQGKFTWRVSTTLPAQFNVTTGTVTPGQQFQLIVYIKSSPGQTGKFFFTFTSGSYTSTVPFTWLG